jgi:putative transposase
MASYVFGVALISALTGRTAMKDQESSMKASKFSEAQIAFVLKQAEDGAAVAEVCRKAGISEATLYNWRKNYAGLMPSGDEAAASARGRVLIEKGLLLWNKAT